MPTKIKSPHNNSRTNIKTLNTKLMQTSMSPMRQFN